MLNNRADFSKRTIDILSKRAAFICSNPDCRMMTIGPSDAKEDFIYVGVAAHIVAASSNGPRSDSSMANDEKSSSENGIFLCSTCSVMIDKNNGIDYPVDLLKKWKSEHENWVKDNLNKQKKTSVTIVDGEHRAKGKGEITGLEINGAAIMKPGTKVIAEGEGRITGTKINGRGG